MKRGIVVALAIIIATSNVAFAGQFKDDDKGLYYVKDDGSYAVNEWIDGDFNNDGILDSYYFNAEGYYDKNAVKVENTDSFVTAETSQFIDDGNGINPDNIPPKVLSAINYIRKICREDELIVIPFSRRIVKKLLDNRGYKKDVRNLAIEKCNVNWQNHAVVFAKAYRGMGCDERSVKELMRIENFDESDIQYALKHIEDLFDNKKYVNPADYMGLSDAQKMQKLLALGLSEESAKDAMVFLSEIQR